MVPVVIVEVVVRVGAKKEKYGCFFLIACWSGIFWRCSFRTFLHVFHTRVKMFHTFVLFFSKCSLCCTRTAWYEIELLCVFVPTVRKDEKFLFPYLQNIRLFSPDENRCTHQSGMFLAFTITITICLFMVTRASARPRDVYMQMRAGHAGGPHQGFPCLLLPGFLSNREPQPSIVFRTGDVAEIFAYPV